MSERIVLVFDICSSTSLIEDLHRTVSVHKLKLLIDEISTFLEKNKDIFHYEIYKFLGDGFILIFESEYQIDSVLEFSLALTYDCNHNIEQFIIDNIENESGIKRKGITIGIDKGNIEDILILGHNEYVGRPINYASRLQGSLDKEEHTNKALISLKLYREIMNDKFKIISSKTNRSFKNIAGNDQMKCYEIDLMLYINKNTESIRKSIKQNIINLDDKEQLRKYSEETVLLATSVSGINSSILKSPIIDTDKYFSIK